MLEEKENRLHECLNMRLGEMLKYIFLLLGELIHSLDSLTSMTAVGASTLNRMQKPACTRQKWLHFLLEFHYRTAKWTDHVRAV